MRRGVLNAAIAALMLGATTAGAQVGYPPDQSPFRDLPQRQEVTLYTGWFVARDDPARVAPQSGPLVGAHYAWRAGGPAHLTVDLARVESERRVIDPERTEECPAASRECKYVGTFRWPLYFADVGMTLSLTGARSFHGIVPQLRTALGFATDFHTRADVGDFAFGTRFAFSWGAGVRWVPGNQFQVRADLVNRLYSVRYPDTYYLAASDGTSIFGGGQSRSAWLNNPAITIGVSYLFAR